ncbi:hypothetical protein ACC699_38285, partial [Rhizobium ruizarguesonis]
MPASDRAADEVDWHVAIHSVILGLYLWLSGQKKAQCRSHGAADCGFSLAAYPAFSAWSGSVRDAIGADHPVYPYSMDPH